MGGWFSHFVCKAYNKKYQNNCSVENILKFSFPVLSVLLKGEIKRLQFICLAASTGYKNLMR